MSEQALVDCDPVSYGCNGGWSDRAIDFMETKSTWALETEYPYTAKDGSCKGTDGSVKLSVHHHKESSTTSALMNVLDNETAPAVAVDASTWSSYTGGVLTACGTSLNHAVQAVGVDASGNWVIRNSWGGRWGESGHITLAAGNTCGVASDVSTPYA